MISMRGVKVLKWVVQTSVNGVSTKERKKKKHKQVIRLSTAITGTYIHYDTLTYVSYCQQ